jgi:hypothetical protein
MQIVNERNGCVVAEVVEVASRLTARLRGLIGRKAFPGGHALLIPGCRQVHTFFMRIPIDAVFLDADNTVIALEKNLPPWSISGYHCRSVHVIELPAGTAVRCEITVGDILEVEGAID